MPPRLIGLHIALALSLLVALLAGHTQPPAHVPRLGLLLFSAPPETHVEAFRHALRDRGYVENHTMLIEERWAEGQAERLPTLAAELVQRPVTVLVAFSTPAALAAQQATRTIPIVISDVGDPVATGLVASLTQPGGNITGVALMSHELMGNAWSCSRRLSPGSPAWPCS
jgi:putative ABC transport system substrate-binding protein